MILKEIFELKYNGATILDLPDEFGVRDMKYSEGKVFMTICSKEEAPRFRRQINPYNHFLQEKFLEGRYYLAQVNVEDDETRSPFYYLMPGHLDKNFELKITTLESLTPTPKDIEKEPMDERAFIKGNMVFVVWNDSYGVTTGWKDVSDYTANELLVKSIGFVMYEDSKVLALALNYAQETELTPEQANGIMVIPKSCIVEQELLSVNYAKYRSSCDSEEGAFVFPCGRGEKSDIEKKLSADMERINHEFLFGSDKSGEAESIIENKQTKKKQ